MTKPSNHERITARIVEALEAADPAKWVRPWASFAHRNGHTQRPYRGINVWMLAIAQMARGYESSEWWTFKQALNDGACVRKGSKGTPISFFKPIVDEDEETGKKKKRLILRTFTVFNREQIDGDLAEPDSTPLALDTAAQEIIAGTGARIEHGHPGAFYSPKLDIIGLPPADAFTGPAGYYATVFHELGHWSGADGRLGRDLTGRFGSEAYAMEELVAELTSAFVCGHAGIATEGTEFESFASYIATWIKVLKEDRYAVFTAAREAQRAADYITSDCQPVAEEEAA